MIYSIHNQVTIKEPKFGNFVALHNTKIQPIFDPCSFYIFLKSCITDALLYLKRVPLHTFYDNPYYNPSNLFAPARLV